MLFKKITMSLVGIVLCGVSVGFLKLGAFGVDPFQALMTGLNKLFPISFGTLYLIANAVFLLFSFCFLRRFFLFFLRFLRLFRFINRNFLSLFVIRFI